MFKLLLWNKTKLKSLQKETVHSLLIVL